MAALCPFGAQYLETLPTRGYAKLARSDGVIVKIIVDPIRVATFFIPVCS